ncbi:putative serine/threonine-protein kinase [Hibiscus syriacus]|uniref:Serine/threonine-protein kinase n=1 Tax=Hibiscus syriacus TaxID=106335 RepID=A0A6A2WE47_HIBSY|nr:uncharacterized protein LOC120197299 [Hibiscus syriacus]KAE8654355.1 putative serine/threonine-protein kinase [Hibiscus syriacus]
MDFSALNNKSNFHARSNSLPSRPHPLIPQIDELLCRLKSYEAASSSSSSITEKLNGLRDMYELVHSFLQLPSTRNSLAQNCNNNQLLNGSLKLLDVCGLAKDALLQAKDDTQQLQSVFRRRRGDDAGFANEAKAYLATRKKANKLINKFLRDLKISKCGFADVEATISMLRDVEGVTFTVLLSVLSYITALISEPKSISWSLFSKLMHSKRVTCQGQASATNEFDRVNAILCSLIGSKTETENAQNELQKLESSIEDIEGGVECLIRVLIKTRVSILNIISH